MGACRERLNAACAGALLMVYHNVPQKSKRDVCPGRIWASLECVLHAGVSAQGVCWGAGWWCRGPYQWGVRRVMRAWAAAAHILRPSCRDAMLASTCPASHIRRNFACALTQRTAAGAGSPAWQHRGAEAAPTFRLHDLSFLHWPPRPAMLVVSWWSVLTQSVNRQWFLSCYTGAAPLKQGWSGCVPAQGR